MLGFAGLRFTRTCRVKLELKPLRLPLAVALSEQAVETGWRRKTTAQEAMMQLLLLLNALSTCSSRSCELPLAQAPSAAHVFKTEIKPLEIPVVLP